MVFGECYPQERRGSYLDDSIKPLGLDRNECVPVGDFTVDLIELL